MYVVTVEFLIRAEHFAAFRARVRQQAADSLRLEEACSRFDVCVDPDAENRVFLYEVYDTREAFELHLASPHFKAFDAEVAEWVIEKRVQSFQRLTP
ncbi:MAG: putative quinol monooxygenase [Pseudomonadota bacterium]